MWTRSLTKAVSFSLLAIFFSLMGGRPAFPFTWTQTTDAEFNLGTKNNVTVTGEGLNGSVALAFGSFTHKREISLNNAAGDLLNDYQINVVLNSGNFDFSKAKPAGEDIRFLDSDDSTWLHYWIEAWDAAAQTAIIWVRVPSIPAGLTKSIHLYYGNPEADSAGDGATTFEFFDDFDSLNNWSQTGSGISVSNGIVTISNSSYTNPTLWADFTIPAPFWAEVKYRHPSRYRNRLYLVSKAGTGPGFDYGIFADSIYWNGWTGTDLSLDTWYIVQWGNTPTDYLWRILGLDGAEVLSRTNGSSIPDLQRLSFSATDQPGSVFSLDWVRIRKLAASEPVVTVGTEGPSSRRIGVFLSSAYDTGQWSAYDALYWNAEAPAGTSLGFQIRTGDTQDELLRSPWYGPGGISDFYQTSGSAVDPIHLNRRWVQYLICLGTNDAIATPAVTSVSVTYEGLGDVAISSDTTWPEGTYHLGNLTVSNGAVFTIGGGSTISASGTITVTGNATIVLQGKNNTGLVNGQWAGVGVTLGANQITVDAGSKISADGQGYTTGNGPGGSGGNWCGASYGGVGSCQVPVYGSALFPVDLGSAGFGAYGGWSNGGGAIRLNVTGTLQLDGEITANGIRSPGGNSWGGAGGSIYVTTGVLRGNGKFSADGAEESGGGRIVVYGEGSGFNRFLASTALAPNTGYPSYATHGTVGFFDTAVPYRHLKVYKDFPLDQDSSLTLGAVTVSAGGILTIGGGSTISVSGAITVTGNAAIVLQGKNNSGPVNGQWAGVGVTLDANQIRVDAGSKISADGQGYTTGNGPGGSGGNWCGASYGGLGDCRVPVYGSSLFPVDLGSAGGGAYGGWSSGGGAIRLNVTGTLQLDGEITADGIRSPGGNTWGGAGGSIYVTTGVLRGNGKFTADGAEVSGGGRVSVYYGEGSGFNGFLASTALAPYTGYPYYTTNGTVGFFDTSVPHRHLKVFKDFALDQDSSLTFGAVTVSGSGILTIGGGSLIRIQGDLSVSNSSKVIPEGKYTNGLVAGQWAGVGVTIYAANVTIEAGSQITATGQGYTTSNGPGGSVPWFTGGSYGGRGSGQSGPTYGSETRPVDLGSAGSAVYGGWSKGGGAIRLNVNDTLTVNGEIKANGDDTSVGGNVGGGAGGSIFIAATNLAGSGGIQANGQTGNSGSGGGGRVAIYYSHLMTLPAGNIAAAGGTGAGNGTVYLSNTPVFELAKPKDSLVHDIATVEWQALAANPVTTADVLLFGSGQQLLMLGLRLPAIGSVSWDTRTIPDGRYELRITFRDGSSHIITEITKEVLVNNSVSWHGGLIEANQTWTSNRVHLVEGDLVIASGVRVTIEPGTVVKFAKGARIIVQDGGLLDAQGTPTQPIIFTSLADDTAGGDINLDGGSSLPLPGDWFGIVVNSGGQFANNEFTAIRYVLTTHSGTIPQNELWMGTFTHHITDHVIISNGVTLTINPGAVIKFDASKTITVQQGGRLVAEGTVASPITFTSIKDDSVGGDTNGDGNSTLPAPGDWQSIVVEGAQATLNHVDVRYGGALPGPQQTAMIVISGTNPLFTLRNSIIRDSLYDGIAGQAGATLVENTVLTGIDRAIGSFSGSITVVNSTLDNNRIGLLVHGGALNVSNTIVTNSFETGVRCDLGCYTTYKYNNVWAPPHPGYQNYYSPPDPTGTNGNVSVDPKYKDTGRGDYRLQYQSPLIDAADGTAAPATDFMGAARYSDPRTPVKKGIPAAGGAFADLGAFEFVETAQSDVDLIITSLQGPSTALAGELVTLQWTISNIGAGEVTGPWHDSVYLVRDAYTNPVELFADEVLVGQGVILGPGQTYTASAQIRVPGSHVGNHHWLVKVNSKGEIFEGVNWENNSGLSASPVYIDLPELGINGAPLSRQFAEVGESHWFKFNPAAGQDVLVQLDLLNNAGTSELYIGRGFMPDPGHFDFRSDEWNAPDVSALASGTSTQTYYVLAYARSLTSSPAGFTIQAATMGFSINYAGPGSVSNNGSVTLKLTGGQLRQDMTYEIVDCNGGVHAAASVFVVNSSVVYATFALNGLPACSYSVRVRYQGNTAVSGTPVAITSAPPGRIEYSLDAPRAIRPDREGTVTLHYRNVGNTDAMAPLMWVTADQAVMSMSNLFLNRGCPGCPPMSPPVTVYNSGYFLGINHEGPAGVLPPGAGGTIALRMAPTVSNGQATFILHTVQDPNAAVNWTEKKGALRPYYISSEAWEAIYANFTARVGNTIGQYNTALAENATALSTLGDYEDNASSLMYFILGQCGLGEINQRYLLGAFGRGRILSYEMWGEVRNGQPVLHYASGKVREFFADGNGAGSYTGVPGDTVRLMVNSGDNTWNLTEPGGTLFHFSPDPTVTGRVRLAYAQDLNSNRVTFSYTSGRLTGLATDNGDTTTYQYNAQGRISRMTDPLGRVTTYTYDASGEHLLSISTPQGTTSFTYVSGQGAAREHAIQSVTVPDGTHTYLEYDGQGRLTRTGRDSGAESKTYAYDGTGGIMITNALGASTRMFFNHFSQLGRMIGPLGAAQEYTYDTNHQLIALTGEGGVRTSMTYDERGNRIGLNTPLGASLSASFGDYGNLTGLIDPLGNLTQYEYDNHHNLKQVIYPDGSVQQFDPDGQGRTIRWVNRRGQAVQYTVNAQGLTTRKEFPDGSGVDYTYDGHRNPQTISDARGIITFTYDGTDRLLRIDYPAGRYLTYTYDAFNRRSSLTTQDGFKMNYTYNTLGRLAGMTDGGGRSLASFTYDPVGRLARKDLGNGTYATYEYDAAGHLLHLVNYNPSGAVLSRFDYQYNNRGLMTRMTTLEGNRDYQYDASGQLTQVTLPGGRTIRYDYDLSGNRTGVADNGAMTEYFTNTLDQYSSMGPAQFHYDLDGNLTSKQTSGGAWTYSYNVENRLIGISGPSLSTTYEYDALGNRVAVVTNGLRREYQHDGGNLIGEYDGAGGLVAHYAHALGLASRIDAAAARHYYHFDGSANTAQVSGTGGGILNTYSYLPFGEHLSLTEAVPNPFTYVGQFGVMDDGVGLYFMRHRFYDPGQGRFVQPDPIGLGGKDANLYRYGGNLPNLRIDPSGLLYGSVITSQMVNQLAQVDWSNQGQVQQFLHTNPAYGSIMGNIQHLTNPDNPISQLPGHYAQQGNYGAAYASIAASVVSMFTGMATYSQSLSHFQNVYAQYSHILNPHMQTHYDANGTFIAQLDDSDPAVQQALTAMNAEFETYLNQQCHNPPPPPDGPCACPQTTAVRMSQLADSPLGGICLCPPLPPGGGGSTAIVTSNDPNVKITVGYGNEGFVTGDTPLVYTIYFENQASATAPAQKVVVTDQLSDKLDWSTVQFFSVGFNKKELFAPSGLQHYETTTSVSTDPNPVGVRADFNANAGVLTWAMQSEDPITHELPQDPLAGFLPPNKADCGGCGEGYVSFLVWPKNTLTSGETIPNLASIVFDVNAPIVTDTVINTIDRLAPASSVQSLPAASLNRFTVTWGGSDNTGGSGIASYFIYVSENGGPFTLWLAGTTETQAVYTGQLGYTYSFYSVAMDHLGNWEAKPGLSEANTVINTIDGIAPTSRVQSLPATSSDRFTVTWGGSDNPGGSGIASYSIYVSEDGGPFTLWLAGTTATQAVYSGQVGHTYGFYSLAIDQSGNREEKQAVPEAITAVNQTQLYLPLIFNSF